MKRRESGGRKQEAAGKAEEKDVIRGAGGAIGESALPLAARDLGLAAVILAAALAAYGTTVCRTLYWGDSAEFAVICPLLDISHPTGYPLFTLLGKLFTMLPLGPLAMRVNLLASAASALASALVYLVGRQLGLGRVLAAFGAGLFALSLEIWDQATAAEVYGLHAALTAATLLAALEFRRCPSFRALLGTAAALGLSFANHLTTLWNVPAVVWLLADGLLSRPVRGAWRPQSRDWKLAAGVFAACLSLYLYVPLRAWQGVLFNHGEPWNFSNLLYHLTGRQFQYRMFVLPDTGLFKEVEGFGNLLAEQFTPWLLPLVVVGIVGLWTKDRRLTVALALVVGTNLLFDLNYHIPDKQGYFLPVYMVAVLWAAHGVAGLVGVLSGAGRDWTARFLEGLSLLLLFLPATANVPKVDKSNNRSLVEFTEQLLGRLPPDSLMVVDDQFLIWSAAYAQLIGGKLTDRIVVNDYLLCLPWYVHHLRRRYPALEIPASVEGLVDERSRAVARAQGWQIGDISQSYAERIAKVLILANLPRRRVFYNFHDSEERKSWQGLALVNRGLFYEAFDRASPPPETPWTTDYPDPAGYRRPEIFDVHHKHVADTYSTACNRAGIALIAAGRHKEAEAAFERSLAYNPDYAQVYLNLGVLYNNHLPDRGKRDRSWKKFLEMAPSDPQAPAIRKALGPGG